MNAAYKSFQIAPLVHRIRGLLFGERIPTFQSRVKLYVGIQYVPDSYSYSETVGTGLRNGLLIRTVKEGQSPSQAGYKMCACVPCHVLDWVSFDVVICDSVENRFLARDGSPNNL